MIRFRLGQRWKRERAPAPVDSFGLELDGIELLPGASEENLLQVVPDLAAAAAALARGEAPSAQVSLAEAHFELLLDRRGSELEIQPVSLERPARVLRPAVRVELSAFVEATERCARALLQDLERHGAARPRRLAKAARALAEAPREMDAPAPGFGYSFRKPALEPGQFGFWLFDPEGRGAGFKLGGAALPALMLPGEVELKLGGMPSWHARGVPFLFALELSRQAQELAAAIESGQARWSFKPGGIEPAIAVDLVQRSATLHGHTHPLDPRQLLRGMFALGGELALAFQHRHRAQHGNPYLEALVRRGREGLAALREVPNRPGDGPATSARPRSPQRPLRTPGTLKRLRFEHLWDQAAIPAEVGGRLLMGPHGPLVSSSEIAAGLTRTGAVRFRRAGSHGVALHPSGAVIAASADRVVAFEGAAPSARWVHDHDGLPLGPWMVFAGGLWLVGSEERGVVAFDQAGGRERWRLMPPRTQRIHFALHDGLAFVATDSGSLFGIDPADGQPRFRIRAPLPFIAPVSRSGKRTYALIGQGDGCGVVSLDATAHPVAWTVELPLARPTFLPHGGRIWVLGQSGSEARMACLTPGGKRVWERAVPVGRPPFHLLPAGREVIAAGQGAAAARLGTDGQIAWRLGEPGEGHPVPAAPSLARGLLLLPGETVRAVDPATGHVLGEIDAGPGLADARADHRLGLYLLGEDGRVRAYRLATHLALVRHAP